MPLARGVGRSALSSGRIWLLTWVGASAAAVRAAKMLRETRLIRPDLPVAFSSGSVTAEIEQSALSAGALALIHKPNDVDEMCETVQRLLQSVDAP